jgi:hypothetical protein
MGGLQDGNGVCSGVSEDHCCYVDGQACPFLEEHTVPGRRWVCGLRRRLGSWTAVHADPGYQEHVRPVWDRLGIVDCGDWPAPGETCGECLVTG